MNFRPELAAKVMAAEKTVTRRLCNDNPRSPWWREKCSLVVGRDYSVCPGRSKPQIGRVVVLSLRREKLHLAFTAAEAHLEGFDTAADLQRAFTQINGKRHRHDLPSNTLVWRVEFEVLA